MALATAVQTSEASVAEARVAVASEAAVQAEEALEAEVLAGRNIITRFLSTRDIQRTCFSKVQNPENRIRPTNKVFQRFFIVEILLV